METYRHHSTAAEIPAAQCPADGVIDVFPPEEWIKNVDDGSRYGGRAGLIGGGAAMCSVFVAQWAVQAGIPCVGIFVVVFGVLAGIVAIPLAVLGRVREERRNFEQIRDETADATIARFCSLVQPAFAFRNIEHLARRLQAIGATGNVFRLLREPTPIEPTPLNIPFEPIPLAASDPRFVMLERSDETVWSRRESHVTEQAWRITNRLRWSMAIPVTACLLAVIMPGVMAGAWLATVLCVAAVAVLGLGLYALISRLLTPRHFITAGTIIHIRPSLLGGCTVLKVFHRTDSTMVILPHKSGLAFIGVADATNTHVLGCLPREADLLLRAWLSTAAAPTREQIASMFGSS